jgi:negative regulator of flagellin synthesis FlgM
MPSVELSKLASVGATRAATASDRAQVEARGPAAAAPAATPGISLEVSDAAPAAAAPPVDAERVAAIRKALAEGSYPLVPTKIADAMIAAQVSLSIPERD